MALIKLNNNSISAVTALPSAIESPITLLKTTTVTSAVSSVVFGDGVDGLVFDGTYNTYEIIISDVNIAIGGQDLILQISDDAGSSFKTDTYRSISSRSGYNGSTTFMDNLVRTDAHQILDNLDSTATETGFARIFIDKPSVSNYQLIQSHGSNRNTDTTAYVFDINSSTFYNASIVCNGFRIMATSGNILQAVIRVFGIK
jgi:hypothetical protein